MDSTVASLQFDIGAAQGTLVLGFCLMAVILFSDTSFKDVGVISSITQPGEDVQWLLKTLCILHDTAGA